MNLAHLVLFKFFSGASPSGAPPEPEPEPEPEQVQQVIPGGFYWQRSIARRRGELPDEEELRQRVEEIEALRQQEIQASKQALEQAQNEFERSRIRAQTKRQQKQRAQERERLTAQLLAKGAAAVALELQLAQQALDAEEENMVILLAAVAASPRL